MFFVFQKSDVVSTLGLLKRCSPYYHNGELTADCLNNPRPCVRVPRECIKHNAVYTILHYLTDHDFMSPENVSTLILYSTRSRPTTTLLDKPNKLFAGSPSALKIGPVLHIRLRHFVHKYSKTLRIYHYDRVLPIDGAQSIITGLEGNLLNKALAEPSSIDSRIIAFKSTYICFSIEKFVEIPQNFFLQSKQNSERFFKLIVLLGDR